MKTLLPPDPFIKTAVQDGRLPESGTACRPSLFALPVKLGGSELVFNTFTRQLIDAEELTELFVSPHDIAFDEESEALNELIKARFIVCADADEASNLSSALRVLQLLGPKDRKKHSSFIILPTTACNARCFYCYESGFEHRTMDDETVDALIRYILETKTEGMVNIRWFGGEPLLAEAVIDRIVEKLNENGVDFVSDIITNASLLTHELAEKAVSKWRVNNAQITFDGRKCEHLKRKAYVDASRDHYTASLEGAQALLELGAAVSIRLNADENNVDELFLLVDELEERFGGKKKPAVYAADMFVGCDREHSAEADRMLYSRLEQLHERIHKAGFLRGNDPRRLRTHRCMVDVPNGGTVVAPDGTLYCCEHMSEDSRIGTLWSHEDEAELRRGFIAANARLQKRPECRNCVYLPECTLGAFCPTIYRDCRKNANLMIVKKLLQFSEKVL